MLLCVLLHRWESGLLHLSEVRILWGEHWVLDRLRGLQESNVSWRFGVQSQQDLWRVHQKWSSQRGKTGCWKSELIQVIYTQNICYSKQMPKTHNSELCHHRSIWISTPKTQSSRASRTPLPLASRQHRGKFTAWWRTTPIPGLSTPTSSKNCVKQPAVTASELSPRQTQHPVLESFVYSCACVNRPLMMLIPIIASGNALNANPVHKEYCGKMQNWCRFYFRPAESFQQWSWDDAICCCRRYTVHFKQMELRSHFLHWAITGILWTSLFEWSILSDDAAQSVAEHVHSKLKTPLDFFSALFSLAMLFECICLNLYNCHVNDVLC